MIYILINVYPKVKHLVTTCFHFKQDYPISQIVIEQKRSYTEPVKANNLNFQCRNPVH